ncbi:MAG: hypothetical protein QM691_02085 [Opitutaceae bacterium]
MNALVHCLVPSLLLLALLPRPAMGAAVDRSVVPAEARWVVGLDLNAVHTTELGRELTDLLAAKTPRSDSTELKLDPQKVLAAIGSITAYGTSFANTPKEMDGVLLLQGSAELRKLAEGYVAQATVTTPDQLQQLTDLPCEAYLVHGEIIVGFPKEPIILVSRSKAQLTKALELYRTHKGSLVNASSPLNALLPSDNSSVLVAASVVPAAEVFGAQEGPHARVLQMAKAGSLVLNLDASNTTASLRLSASSEEMADKLQKIVQGIAAMVSLAETSDKQLTEFLQSVNTTREGTFVSTRLTYPTDGIVRIVHNLRQELEATPNGHVAPLHDDAGSQTIARWTADAAIGQPVPTAEGLVFHTIENVPLKNGMIITITGQREDGENARLDCVEIAPAGGGTPLVFEAENMKLSHYRVEAAPFASRGRLILAVDKIAKARFEFPGADGAYTIKVRYVDESDGKATFSLSTREPTPAADPQ